MSILLKKGQYTTIAPQDIWKIYSKFHGVFRGGGNTKSPKLVRADGPRRSDLDIRVDQQTGIEMVYPNPIKGISFADSVRTLADKMVEGQVWVIPSNKKIEGDLIFNIKDESHPLLNVSRPMPVIELTVLLTKLALLMKPCDIKIDKNGNIIEKYPGALSKASNI